MRSTRILISTAAALLLLAACTTYQPPEADGAPSRDITALALESSVIDFEGLAEGAVVDAVSSGAGISGFDAGGAVGVFGLNPAFGGLTNTAIIFDATCDGAVDASEALTQCSGGVYAPGEMGTGPGAYAPGNGSSDDDLWDDPSSDPVLGNTLIIAENLVDADSDGTIDDPDDADTFGEAFFFDFSGWDGGAVVIGAMSVVMDVQDVEAEEEDGAAVTLYSDLFTTVLAILPIPQTGDSTPGVVENTLAVNYQGVVSMTVDLQGSGEIDNITIATEIPEEGEGCTPGYWRNHSAYARGNQQDAWIGTGYDADDDFDTVFGVTSSDGDTLYQAVTSGGGGEQALQRHAVAALLNAASSVDYLYSEADVIALVQSAYGSGQFEGTKNLLAFQNELGCPLD